MNIKQLIREEIQKLDEQELILSKDEMNILHRDKEIEKDGHVIKFEEGFSGELSKKEKKKFNKERLENAEVLGYKLTGKKDINEASKTRLKTGLGPALGQLEQALWDVSEIHFAIGRKFKKQIGHLRKNPFWSKIPNDSWKAQQRLKKVRKNLFGESVFAVNLDKEKNDERYPEQPNINYDPEKGKSRIRKIRENKVWERKFGEPLPTLDSVMKKHQENKLNESPVSVLKPAKVEKNSIIYGYINLKAYYNPVRKGWNELKNLLDKIDYTSIGFTDREDIKVPHSLNGWQEFFVKEPMVTSFRKMHKFLSNPKMMKEPDRVRSEIHPSVNTSALPKWKQLTHLYKVYLKFNNKKVSSVFKQTRGKKIGQKLIGDFGGFELTQNVHKLLTNKKGFTQRYVNDEFKEMDYHSNKKIMVRGPRD